MITSLNEEDLRRIIREELNKSLNSNNNNNNNNNSRQQEKNKRPPSKWNLFLSNCSKEQPASLNMGDKAKACSVEYKKVKDKLEIVDDKLQFTK